MQIIKTAGIIFECEDDLEVIRATTLLTKEPGTIAWLDNNLGPDDVFWDVGANIGCYSLFVAMRGVMVCAFEPHVANARSLLRNIRANRQASLGTPYVKVITSPLGDLDGWLQFFYASDAPGSSGSQLGPAIDEHGKPFQPVACETKWATTGDSFVRNTGNCPDLIKIDVDGLELSVLRGMESLLLNNPPRSIQVEIHQHTDADIVKFLEYYGYRLDHRHHTSHGQKAIAKGADPLSVPHNAVFVRT
jgi:FkbM family methyltransferase